MLAVLGKVSVTAVEESVCRVASGMDLAGAVLACDSSKASTQSPKHTSTRQHSPHSVTNRHDVVSFCFQLTDATRVSQDTLPRLELGCARVEEYDGSRCCRPYQLRCSSEVQER